MKTKNLFIVFLLTAISFLSCKKGPGIGGDASISGKVFVKHYNTDFTNFTNQIKVTAPITATRIEPINPAT